MAAGGRPYCAPERRMRTRGLVSRRPAPQTPEKRAKPRCSRAFLPPARGVKCATRRRYNAHDIDSGVATDLKTKLWCACVFSCVHIRSGVGGRSPQDGGWNHAVRKGKKPSLKLGSLSRAAVNSPGRESDEMCHFFD